MLVIPPAVVTLAGWLYLGGGRYVSTENAYASQEFLVMAWPLRGYEKSGALMETATRFSQVARLKHGKMHAELVQAGRAQDFYWDCAPTWSPTSLRLTIIPEKDSARACVEAVYASLIDMAEAGYFSADDLGGVRVHTDTTAWIGFVVVAPDKEIV